MSTLRVTPGPVTVVSLNRPEVRNALNDALIAELSAWAASVVGDHGVRVVVLQGEGPAFCAGADLQWMARLAAYSPEENLADARAAARLFAALDALPVPVVGRIQGAALGGGVGLAAVCDIVIASTDAVFGLTETTIGLLPAMISPYVDTKIGASAARALALTGERFSASRAHAIGLVHEVVAPDALDAAVERHVGLFGKTSPAAVTETKRLFRRIHGRPTADVLALTVDAIATQRASAEGQEGMRAFLAKRAPAWATTLTVPPRT